MTGHDQSVDSQIGRVLEGKYELVRLLGQGGMGAVYEANHRLIGRRFAVKLLHAEFTGDEDTVRRFEQEARIATAIGHDHIIDITDMGRTEEGELFIAMEFLEGRDLAYLLRMEAPLPLRRACHIVVQMLSALEAAHETGIVHRDLKPANVFLSPRGIDPDYVKIVDFGISKVRDARAGLSLGMTQDGDILGTPLYMSPEQARGDVDVTPASDIYAVGVILFEMLTARLPFNADSLTHLLGKIMGEKPANIAELRPDLPGEIVDAINCALEKDVGDRFDSVKSFRRVVGEFSPETSSIAGLKTTRISARHAGLSERIGKSKGEQSGASDITTSMELELTTNRTKASGISARGKNVLVPILFTVGTIVLVGALFLGVFGWRMSANKREFAAVSTEAGVFIDTAVVGQVKSPEVVVAAAVENTPVDLSVAKEASDSIDTAQKRINLKFDVEPSFSEIFVDGQMVGTGSFLIPVPADEREHKIMVQATGYQSVEQSVSFEGEPVVEIRLKRNPSNRTNKRRRPSSPNADKEKVGVSPIEVPSDSIPTPGSGERVIDESVPW